MKTVELSYKELQTANLFVGLDGATLAAVTPSGEVLFTQGLVPGAYPAKEWLSWLEPDEGLFLEGDVSAVSPRRNRTKRVVYGEGATATSANPDFRPTRESRFEKEIRRTVEGLTRKVARQQEQLISEREQRRAERQQLRAEREGQREVEGREPETQIDAGDVIEDTPPAPKQ